MDQVHLSDADFNRLMDDIVDGTGGHPQRVIDEIIRLGLHRQGVGRCPSLPDEPKKKKKP